MTSYTVSPKSGYGGCLLFIAVPLILLSCHVTRSVATTHTNVDSIVSHVRDSSAHVTKMISEVYEGRIRELTNSSVVFETQPCPDITPLRATLDSIGKVNYDLFIVKDSTIRALQNRVTISANGAITATGQVRSVTVSNSRLQEENHSLSLRNDSLWHVVDSQKVVLSKKVDDKQVVIKRSVSWWFWVLFAIGCVVSLGVGVALERKFG